MHRYQFDSYVCRVDGAMNPHGIPVPDVVYEPLRKAGVKRLIVTINGYEMKRGLQGSREFGGHIVVGKQLLDKAGVAHDDKVRIVLKADPNPEQIDVPDELLISLEQDKEANRRWESLAPGKRRGLAYHVSSAKREETRIKRALDVAMKLRARTLHGD